MKKQLQKKLYSLIIMIMFSVAIANAQIIYTDAIPDTGKACSATVSTGGCTFSYDCDINNDGSLDFRLSGGAFYAPAFHVFSSSVTFTPIDSNMVWTEGTTTLEGHDLDSNKIIQNNNNWNYSSAGYKLRVNNGGSWPNNIFKYLGVKLKVGTSYYYGWIRLMVSSLTISSAHSTASFTISDYGCNSLPNQPVLAGETSCAMPTVNLTQSGSLSFCAGDSVTFTANGTGYKYQWKKNNVNISGATSKAYAAKTAGVYKCKVTNSCGSKTSGSKTVTVPCRNSNDNFVETSEQLSVYPNPATNSVTIQFPSDEDGELQIVNLFGQIVFSEKINAEQTQIDVSRFTAGLYVIRWISGDNFETKTFSVIK